MLNWIKKQYQNVLDRVGNDLAAKAPLPPSPNTLAGSELNKLSQSIYQSSKLLAAASITRTRIIALWGFTTSLVATTAFYLHSREQQRELKIQRLERRLEESRLLQWHSYTALRKNDEHLLVVNTYLEAYKSLFDNVTSYVDGCRVHEWRNRVKQWKEELESKVKNDTEQRQRAYADDNQRHMILTQAVFDPNGEINSPGEWVDLLDQAQARLAAPSQEIEKTLMQQAQPQPQQQQLTVPLLEAAQQAIEHQAQNTEAVSQIKGVVKKETPS